MDHWGLSTQWAHKIQISPAADSTVSFSAEKSKKARQENVPYTFLTIWYPEDIKIEWGANWQYANFVEIRLSSLKEPLGANYDACLIGNLSFHQKVKKKCFEKW